MWNRKTEGDWSNSSEEASLPQVSLFNTLCILSDFYLYVSRSQMLYSLSLSLSLSLALSLIVFYLVTVWITIIPTSTFYNCVFLFFFFFFFFFFFSAAIVDFVNCEQWICALFTVPQITLFYNFFINNGSHSTIYTFKNYFATVFSVSVFSFSKNKLNPNTPLI